MQSLDLDLQITLFLRTLCIMQKSGLMENPAVEIDFPTVRGMAWEWTHFISTLCFQPVYNCTALYFFHVHVIKFGGHYLLSNIVEDACGKCFQRGIGPSRRPMMGIKAAVLF